jgi:dTDP-4-dehydrorhamnose reductase
MLGHRVAAAFAVQPATELLPARRDAEPGAITFDAEDGRDAVDRLVDRLAPGDVVVNCIAVLAGDVDDGSSAGRQRALLVNALFPHTLALACADRDARLIHISTDGVFAPESGPCDEHSQAFAHDVYGATKRLGEPLSPNAISLRTSIIGPDPRRGRGLLEWCRRQPPGSTVRGFTDQRWNGVSTDELAEVCVALADRDRFQQARAEGSVHHVFGDPVTKFDVVAAVTVVLRPDLVVEASASGAPISRVLTTRYRALADLLPTARSMTDVIGRLMDSTPSARTRPPQTRQQGDQCPSP